MVMRAKNNLEWDVKHLRESIEKRFREIQEKGLRPYGILMNPETLHSIVTSTEYWKEMPPSSMGSKELFYYTVVSDLDMHLGDWEILTRHA